MLADWQIWCLDHGLVIVPILVALGLLAFPWKHWNQILEKNDGGY